MHYENTGKSTIVFLQRKKKMMEVVWENQEIWKIPVELSMDFFLYEGKEMLQEEKRQLQEKISFYEAFQDARNRLARKDYSEGELRKKLQEKYDEKKVQEVLQELKTRRLLSDERIKEQWLALCFDKKYGPEFAKEKLRKKGIPWQEDDFLRWKGLEEEFIQEWVERLSNKEKGSNEEKKRKMEEKIVRLGFSRYKVKKYVEHIEKDEEEEKESFLRLYEKYRRKKVKGTEYEKKQKMFKYFVSHGYSYDDILRWIEETKYE